MDTYWNKLKKQEISPEVDSQTYWNKNEAGAYNWYKKNQNYWDSLQENIDKLHSVYIIGGEPTVNPEFKKLYKIVLLLVMPNILIYVLILTDKY